MRILSIGGGEIGRPKTEIETESIDRENIRLTGKRHPKLLLLPTASGDDIRYYDVVKNYYGTRLGCKTDVLYLINERPTLKEIRNKILNSDIIYVGGGNTLKMLKVWRKYGIDKVLEEAVNKGIILSGVSAGAICWFKYGNSDSFKFKAQGKSEEKPLVKLKGLDFIPLMACPHYDFEKDRKPSLFKMIQKYGGMALALDNCSAIDIINENNSYDIKDMKYRILTSSKTANAYRVYKFNGKVIEEALPKDGKFRSLDELLKR